MKNRKHHRQQSSNKIVNVKLPTARAQSLPNAASLVIPSPSAEIAPPTPMLTAVAVDPLVDEVQTFLQQRETLAQKLAEEIAATEKKLADLKRTASLLYPEKTVAAVKDRKVKKLKKARPLVDRGESTEPTETLSPANESV